jgi:hypothetical protein
LVAQASHPELISRRTSVEPAVEDAPHRARMSVQPLKTSDALAYPGDPAMPTGPVILKVCPPLPFCPQLPPCDPAPRLMPVLPRPTSPAMPTVPIASL